MLSYIILNCTTVVLQKGLGVMGFLRNLLNREAKKGLSTTASPSSGSAFRVHREIGKSIAYNEAALRSLLEKNFEELFPEYEVRKNVPASQLNAEAGAENYSYGLFRNGQPKAMIMILIQSNDYRLARIRKAQAACQTQGIPYMNFMYYLPNREDYVANRLRSTILG